MRMTLWMGDFTPIATFRFSFKGKGNLTPWVGGTVALGLWGCQLGEGVVGPRVGVGGVRFGVVVWSTQPSRSFA